MIIFDFDGTLADTITLGISLINDYSERFKYDKITQEDKEHLSTFELVKKMGIKFWKLPYLVWFLRKKVGEKADEINIFPGIKELLNDLQTSGYKLGIITSNSSSTVTDFLKRNDIASYFSYIKTNVPAFGKKVAIFKAKKQLKRDFVYVGDEIRDIEACRLSNIPVISVTWGFNSLASLEQHNPGLVAKTPEEALKLIKQTAEQYFKS